MSEAGPLAVQHDVISRPMIPTTTSAGVAAETVPSGSTASRIRAPVTGHVDITSGARRA
jgi:hypothetical protein